MKTTETLAKFNKQENYEEIKNYLESVEEFTEHPVFGGKIRPGEFTSYCFLENPQGEIPYFVEITRKGSGNNTAYEISVSDGFPIKNKLKKDITNIIEE